MLKKSTAEVLRRKDGSCNAWTKREMADAARLALAHREELLV